MIKLTVEGLEYYFDDDRMLVAEAREIKTLTGLSVRRLFSGVEEGDVDAIASLIYLAKKRAGETLRFSDLDGLNIADVDLEVVQPVGQGEAAAQGEGSAATPADPTPPSGSGTIPTAGTGSTSAPSPTTSSTVPATSAS